VVEPNDLPRALRELLEASHRDESPGAARVLGLAPDDPPELRSLLELRALRVVQLERRGVSHGEWAEFEAAAPTTSPRAEWAQRFARAAPIVLPGLVSPEQLEEHGAELRARMQLYEQLNGERAGGLREFALASLSGLRPEFHVTERARSEAPPADPRDLERVGIHRASDGRGDALEDLWLKFSRLSTHAADRSLRLRFSFGHEVEDDASRDLRRHLAVTELAERLVPECLLAHGSGPLRRLLDEWIGRETFLSQHIAYWNAPKGGALFHHDAFDEPLEGGQRGVVYMQLTGTSAWLALPIAALAAHVVEFAALLAAGEAPWVRAALFPNTNVFERFTELVSNRPRLLAELALPGCGELAAVVNRGPEFTGLLADAGHAWLLDPGDVIVLPNHGFAATCMHSVFCASDEPGYALSMAIRERHPRVPLGASERRARRRR
jgi:hypothetical protein